MSSGRVACVCRKDLPPDIENAGEFVGCPRCLREVRVFAFRALRRSVAPVVPPPLAEGEASCFYHPQKPAVLACEHCGRFLCALCDIEIGGQHRCPACLAVGKQSQTLPRLETHRPLYDGLALGLALVPILIWPLTLLSAPAALFVVIRYWRRPLSILPRTRIRFVIAGLIALAQICGWAVLFYFLIARARMGGGGG